MSCEQAIDSKRCFPAFNAVILKYPIKIFNSLKDDDPDKIVCTANSCDLSETWNSIMFIGFDHNCLHQVNY